MIGRVNTLSAKSASGSIRTQNGEKVFFDSSAVPAHDVTCFAVGQLVSFDMEVGQRAVNVRLNRQTPLPEPREKTPEHLRPRYLGFEQTGSVRVYRFERAVPREEKKTFIVTADLALFIKHHVGVQEGPALCLRILTMELDAFQSPEPPSSSHALTDSDMLAYVFFRNAATVKKHGSKTRTSTKTSLI